MVTYRHRLWPAPPNAPPITPDRAATRSTPDLITLAERYSAVLRPGKAVQQADAPALMAGQQHYQHIDGPRLSLVFALEHLPPESDKALEFLCYWINAEKTGGLFAQLRQQQLIATLKATPLYHFKDQALLHLEFTANNDIAPHATYISDTFHDWLRFFRAQQDWPALREELRLLLQRQQDTSSALELARSDCEQHAPGLSDQGVSTLKAVLGQLQPEALQPSQHAWQLPAPNPFLQPPKEPLSAGLIRGQTSAHRGLRTFAQDRLRSRRDLSAMGFSTALPSLSGEAAIYLRWRLPAKPADNPLPALENSLRSLILEARHAGVELSLNALGNQWQPVVAVHRKVVQEIYRPER